MIVCVRKLFLKTICCCLLFGLFLQGNAQTNPVKFHVVSFYTSRNDQAHISFVHEAHKWLLSVGAKNDFSYDSTTDWRNMNPDFLSKYQVVIFLDTRPEDAAQRDTLLASIDPSSFPLGTGPKPDEIWHSGYYPVVWTNTRYKMIYLNIGHNDIDYEHKTNKELSLTFNNPVQDKLVLDGILWLGGRARNNRVGYLKKSLSKQQL